jgi:acetoin utilization deacetylase AcuC-like enzyme
MKTFYTAAHLAHDPGMEFEAGRLSPAVEIPARAERVLAEIGARKLGAVLTPKTFADGLISRVHDAGLIAFLEDAHRSWLERHGQDAPNAIPSAWPARGMKPRWRDGDVETQLGTYSFDTATPIMKGTWRAARDAVNVALSAADSVLNGDRAAFGLTRPPGHHAGGDIFGGYCYLNNVAIAAQWLVDQGKRVAILDVDYHHGNGTQSIFYARSEVLFVSVHADPAFAFPHFLGFADETGEAAGEGANLNIPLGKGTDWASYAVALGHGISRVRAFGPDVLLVSLGLDTFEDDPIARFALKRIDYFRLGEAIASARLPTVFLFEGGYNIDALGEITVNVLEGFEAH